MTTPPFLGFKEQAEALISKASTYGAKHKVNKDQLVDDLAVFLSCQSHTLEAAAKNLHALIRSEGALTIPLSDGCVAKVNFTGELNPTNIQAFARIFQTIADSYFVTEAQRANAGEPLPASDSPEEPQPKKQ